MSRSDFDTFFFCIITINRLLNMQKVSNVKRIKTPFQNEKCLFYVKSKRNYFIITFFFVLFVMDQGQSL